MLSALVGFWRKMKPKVKAAFGILAFMWLVVTWAAWPVGVIILSLVALGWCLYTLTEYFIDG